MADKDMMKNAFGALAVISILSGLFTAASPDGFNVGEGDLNINNEDGTSNIVEHARGGGRRHGGGGRRWGGRRRGPVSWGGAYSNIGSSWPPYGWYGGDVIVDGQIEIPTCTTTVNGNVRTGRLVDGQCMLHPGEIDNA